MLFRSAVHNVFHVSNLKKCLSDETLIVPLKELTIDEQLHFVEEPVEITDRDVKVLKNTRIPLVRVRWNSRRGPEFTWEREDQMKLKYPQLFKNNATTTEAEATTEFRDEIPNQRGDDVTPQEKPVNDTTYLASSVSTYQISRRNFFQVGDNVTTRILEPSLVLRVNLYERCVTS